MILYLPEDMMRIDVRKVRKRPRAGACGHVDEYCGIRYCSRYVQRCTYVLRLTRRALRHDVTVCLQNKHQLMHLSETSFVNR